MWGLWHGGKAKTRDRVPARYHLTLPSPSLGEGSANRSIDHILLLSKEELEEVKQIIEILKIMV